MLNRQRAENALQFLSRHAVPEKEQLSLIVVPGLRQVKIPEECDDGRFLHVPLKGLLADLRALFRLGRARDAADRLLLHDVGHGHCQVIVAQQTGQTDSLDGVAAQLKEAVQRPGGRFHVQDLLHRRRNRLLRGAGRFHVFPCGNLRFRQRLPVDLAVGRHGHVFQPHVNGRNHIVRQRFGKERLQRARIDLPVSRVIKHKGIPAHLRRHGPNALILGGPVFDFSHLNAEAAQLHLVVDAPQVFQLSLRVPAGQVPRPVHFFAGQPGAVHERFCRQIRAVPVPFRDLGSRQAQFARHPPGQQAAVRVTHEGITVIKRPSDGDRVVAFALPQFEVCGIHREFRGPVGVVHRSPGLWYGGHRLAAQAQIIHIQRLSPCQQLTELSGIAAAADGVRLQIAPHLLHVPPYLFRHDEQLPARRQHGIQILHRGVKSEVGMAGDPALFRQPPAARDEVNEVCQRPVGNHDALGPAGGSGRVYHVGQRVRPGAKHRLRVRALPHRLPDRLLGQQQGSLRIFQHIADAVLRIIRVDGHIGRPRLVDADGRRREFLHPAHAQGDKAVFPDPLTDQPRGDGVGGPVQFRVGITAFAVCHGLMLRRCLNLLPEQVQPGFTCVIGHRFAPGQLQQRRHFFIGHQADSGKVFPAHHLFQHQIVAGGKIVDEAPAVPVRVVFHMQVQPIPFSRQLPGKHGAGSVEGHVLLHGRHTVQMRHGAHLILPDEHYIAGNPCGSGQFSKGKNIVRHIAQQLFFHRGAQIRHRNVACGIETQGQRLHKHGNGTPGPAVLASVVYGGEYRRFFPGISGQQYPEGRCCHDVFSQPVLRAEFPECGDGCRQRDGFVGIDRLLAMVIPFGQRRRFDVAELFHIP